MLLLNKEKITLIVIVLFVVVTGTLEGFFWLESNNHSSFNKDWIERADPEELGMDSDKLQDIIKWIRRENQYQIDSLIVIYKDKLVLEEYLSLEEHIDQSTSYRDNKHAIASCTKSIVSSLVGIAIHEGFIENVNQKVLDFFPDMDIQNVDERKEAMTIEDLLTMRTGLDWYQPASYSPDHDKSISNKMRNSQNWAKFVLDRPMVATPGTSFVYCNGASHLLSSILERTTGMRTLDFARKYLFSYLDIMDINWIQSTEGTYYGGGSFLLSPIDLAKFGHLYLNNGSWKGVQVIPESWITNATKDHVPRDGVTGYGYQWWVCPEAGYYYAWGAGFNRIVVVPEYNLVISMNADIFTAANPTLGLIDQIITTIDIEDKTVYSEYGFSFPYSNNLPIIERSDIIGLISNNSGRLDVNTGKFPILKYEIYWQSVISPPNLSQVLEEYWYSFEVRNPFLPFSWAGSRISGMKDSHNLLYQEIVLEQSGDSFPGVTFCWYCEDYSRFYVATYYDIDIDLVNNALKFINTINCH